MLDAIQAAQTTLSDVPWQSLALTGALAGAALLWAAKTGVAIVHWLRSLPADRRANLAENTLVGFFVAVTAGLIMQGLVGFAADDMGLTGPWPYLLFAAFDGMAAFFGAVAYRWAQQGAAVVGPRLMVLLIVAGSAWFQWEHAADRPLAARVAWAALPLIAAALWETVLITRRRAWRKKQKRAGRPVPRARWVWDPAGSAAIARRMHLWHVTDWEEALELHMVRLEAVRRLRREFGPLWAWRVPADVAVRLRKGFRIREAAEGVDAIIREHRSAREQHELEKALQKTQNSRKDAKDDARTVTAPHAPESHDLPDVDPPNAKDPDVLARAVEDIRIARDLNQPIPSERRICELYGVPSTNRRWAKKVLALSAEPAARGL